MNLKCLVRMTLFEQRFGVLTLTYKNSSQYRKSVYLISWDKVISDVPFWAYVKSLKSKTQKSLTHLRHGFIGGFFSSSLIGEAVTRKLFEICKSPFDTDNLRNRVWTAEFCTTRVTIIAKRLGVLHVRTFVGEIRISTIIRWRKVKGKEDFVWLG